MVISTMTLYIRHRITARVVHCNPIVCNKVLLFSTAKKKNQSRYYYKAYIVPIYETPVLTRGLTSRREKQNFKKKKPKKKKKQ